MGQWATRGLRGSVLEEMINLTNESYRQKSLGLIQKIPTPIVPISFNKDKGLIDKAYFEQKSTVDYIGVIQGIPVCFDAKETKRESFPLCNIHNHQINYMEQFKKQKGISFLIVKFSKYDECYFLPFEDLKFYYDLSKENGRKSIAYDNFNKDYLIESSNGFFVHYLKVLDKYLAKLE